MLELDEKEWAHIGDTEWDEEANGKEAEVVYGWVHSTSWSLNTITVDVCTSDRKHRSKKTPETLVTYTLDTLLPALVSTQHDFSTSLKLGMCLLPLETPGSAMLIQLSVYLNLERVHTLWAHAKTIPCFGDVFRLFEFFDFFPRAKPQVTLSSKNDILAWMRRQEAPASCPVLDMKPLHYLTRIPGTSIVISGHHSLCDLSDLYVQPVDVKCAGGVLVGPTGVGKFSSCVRFAMNSHGAVSSHASRTHSKATVFLVPSSAVSWRLKQLRQMVPKSKTIVILTSKHDVAKVRWRDLLHADFIVVSTHLLNNKVYVQHLNGVVNTISHKPETFLPQRKAADPPSTTRKRRREREELDIGIDTHALFDTDLKQTSDASTSIGDDAGFSCECVRRVLNSAELDWESFYSPVLEVLTYARVVFVDHDRYSSTTSRLRLFTADARWATASSFLPKETLIVLPASITSPNLLFNTRIKHVFVRSHMLCTLERATKMGEPTRVHTRLLMTPREALNKSSLHILLDPHIDTSSHNVVFVKQDQMAAQAIKAAHQHFDALVAKRDILQTDLARENNENNGLVDYEDDDNEEEEAIEDDDEDEDYNDDDDDGFEVHFDISDESGLRTAMESFFLEFTPERMEQSLQEVTNQIADFERDEESLKTRIENVIETVIGKDSCVICSSSKCNALLGCGHAFCVNCIVKWRETKNSCPTCNQPAATVIAHEELEPVPCPIAGTEQLWNRVWKHQNMTSQLYWIVQTLQRIESEGFKAVIMVNSSTDGRALLKALTDERISAKFLYGTYSSRTTAMHAFEVGRVHIIATRADVLSGAGLNSVTHAVIADSIPDGNDAFLDGLLARFHELRSLHTYSSITDED